MSGTLLVRGARQLLTLRGAAEPRRGSALRELGILRDGALLIADGRIVEVSVSRRVENLIQAQRSEEIDATGRVVMPGFVDCHAHLFGMAECSGDADDTSGAPKSASGALRNNSGKRLESRARQLIHGMVRHGTTTVGAESGYGLDQRAELKILRVQAKLNRAPLDIASTFLTPQGLPAAFDLSSAMLSAIHNRGLARFVGVRHDDGMPDAGCIRRYLDIARSLGFQLKIHAGRGLGSEAVRLAVCMGAVSVDHLEDTAPADEEMLATSNTMAVLLPGCAFDRGSVRRALARDLIDAGAAVALASNYNPQTSPSYNMQTMIALACAHWGLTPEEAICAATFNAASAIGAASEAGSLESGKSADLIVLNVADYREIPRNFGVNLVHCAVKRGVVIYQEGNVAR